MPLLGHFCTTYIVSLFLCSLPSSFAHGQLNAVEGQRNYSKFQVTRLGMLSEQRFRLLNEEMAKLREYLAATEKQLNDLKRTLDKETYTPKSQSFAWTVEFYKFMPPVQFGSGENCLLARVIREREPSKVWALLVEKC
ncbi:unnamed protein product [Protopolystoma xenopodis]|uniref:Uncharacterized protein n=1 Tax=Protopolystoma xenopodis TaxID=117903 RepID=A0A3S5ANA0_9PLAT|nr:unnamed protein product [Protopolystoma xenopodis]